MIATPTQCEKTYTKISTIQAIIRASQCFLWHRNIKFAEFEGVVLFVDRCSLMKLVKYDEFFFLNLLVATLIIPVSKFPKFHEKNSYNSCTLSTHAE